MVLTKTQKWDAITHILKNVFDLDDDSELHRAFTKHCFLSPHDIVFADDFIFENLDYKDDEGNVHPLPLCYLGLLQAFHAYCIHQSGTNGPITDKAWTAITSDEFDEFHVSYPTTGPSLSNSAPTGTTPGPSSTSSSHYDPVKDFKRGIRRDQTLFIPLKDDGAWDSWNRATQAQAMAQGVDDVLNLNYTPNTPQEKALFDEMQKYMYAVFEKTLLTDKGKTLVRDHQRKHDARAIYKGLSEYALSSTKASLDASTLLTYITTS